MSFAGVGSSTAAAEEVISTKLQGVLNRTGFAKDDLEILPGNYIRLEDGKGGVRDYKVRGGENLSQIAQREMGNPVFVPDGSMDRLLRLNPELKGHGGMVIRREPLGPLSGVAAAPVVPAAPKEEPTPSKSYAVVQLMPGRVTRVETPLPEKVPEPAKVEEVKEAPKVVAEESPKVVDSPKAVEPAKVEEVKEVKAEPPKVEEPKKVAEAPKVVEETKPVVVEPPKVEEPKVVEQPAPELPVQPIIMPSPKCYDAGTKTRDAVYGKVVTGSMPVMAFRPTKDGFNYMMQSGDTLSKIAEEWFQSKDFARLKGVETLRSWNPKLVAGQEPKPGSQLHLKIITWQAKGKEMIVCEPLPQENRTPASAPDSYVEAAPAQPSAPPTPKVMVEIGKLGVGLKTSSWSVKARDRANGGRAVANSNLNFGLEPRFVQAGDNGVVSSFFVNVTRNSVIQPPSHKFAQDSFITYAFGADVAIPTSKEGELTFGVKRTQQFFIEALSTTTYSITNVPIVEFSGAYRRILYNANKGNGAVVVGGSALLPGASDTFDVNFGTIFRVGYESIIRLRLYELVGGLYYEWKKQNTSLVDQNAQEVWLGLGIRWRLYDEK